MLTKQSILENRGEQFALIFYDLESSHMNAVDDYKVSKVCVTD